MYILLSKLTELSNLRRLYTVSVIIFLLSHVLPHPFCKDVVAPIYPHAVGQIWGLGAYRQALQH